MTGHRVTPSMIVLPKHSDTCVDHTCEGECQLPESLRAEARMRTCGDPMCYWEEHLKEATK